MKKYIFYPLFLFFSLPFFSYGQQNVRTNKLSAVAENILSQREIFEHSIKKIYKQIQGDIYGLDYNAFRYAYIGYQNMKIQNKLNEKRLLSIIDFTKNSSQKRFYTIDLENQLILYHTFVAHGKKTGIETATYFSDKNDSNKSSLGFYVTGKTYNGDAGFSLKLHGDERNYNSNAYKRGIVIHTAEYMDESFLKKNRRFGRSLGCPVLPASIYKDVIETIKEGTLVFAYYNNKQYLSSSKYLKINNLTESGLY